MIKKNEGFTLIELVVAMAASVTVMAAAFTVLMFGTRVEAQTTDIISDRQSVTLQMANLDSLVQNSEISKVEILADDWTLYSTGKDDEDVELMSYDADTQVLSCASGFEMSDIRATLELNDNQTLLTLTVKTENGLEYSVSARCHMSISETTNNPTAVVLQDIQNKKTGILGNAGKTTTARQTFLLLLASQYGSTGEILNSGDGANQLTFAQWYNPEWPSDTPWCACFVSWGIALANKLGCLEPLSEGEELPFFASVGDGYKFFENSTKANVGLRTDNKPAAGDIIFFNWPNTVEQYDHVGVVLYVDGDNIYTIEGNSNNRVAMRLYNINDDCIIGYGVLDWVEDQPTTSN